MATITNSLNNSANFFTSTTGFTATTGPITATSGNIVITSGQLILGTSAGTNGQIPIAATSGNPAWATLTSSGGTIAFTAGANTLNLESTVAGFTWAAASTNASFVNGYGVINTKTTLLTMTLPTTAAVGTRIGIQGSATGAGGWLIAQNASQNISFGSSISTTGTGGSLASTNVHDSVDLICVVANITWEVNSSIGNITVT